MDAEKEQVAQEWSFFRGLGFHVNAWVMGNEPNSAMNWLAPERENAYSWRGFGGIRLQILEIGIKPVHNI